MAWGWNQVIQQYMQAKQQARDMMMAKQQLALQKEQIKQAKEKLALAKEQQLWDMGFSETKQQDLQNYRTTQNKISQENADTNKANAQRQKLADTEKLRKDVIDINTKIYGQGDEPVNTEAFLTGKEPTLLARKTDTGTIYEVKETAPKNYTVAKGESPATIAKKFKVTTVALLNANSDKVHTSRSGLTKYFNTGAKITIPGTQVKVPAGTKTTTQIEPANLAQTAQQVPMDAVKREMGTYTYLTKHAGEQFYVDLWKEFGADNKGRQALLEKLNKDYMTNEINKTNAKGTAKGAYNIIGDMYTTAIHNAQGLTMSTPGLLDKLNSTGKLKEYVALMTKEIYLQRLWSYYEANKDNQKIRTNVMRAASPLIGIFIEDLRRDKIKDPTKNPTDPKATIKLDDIMKIDKSKALANGDFLNFIDLLEGK